MKKLTLSILTCLIFLTPNMVMSETMDDLVGREGLYYKKFTEVPFTGKITGKSQGAIKIGKPDGAWVEYHSNGQLFYKGNYKNGKEEGAWVGYHDDGQLFYKGNYKNGEEEGAWVYYHENGQLSSKGNYKNGEKEGAWVVYKKDGTVLDDGTETYKNGEKVSD
jgi:antitoxin component YwqK of YwqJK toxin-antitoxin module